MGFFPPTRSLSSISTNIEERQKWAGTASNKTLILGEIWLQVMRIFKSAFLFSANIWPLLFSSCKKAEHGGKGLYSDLQHHYWGGWYKTRFIKLPPRQSHASMKAHGQSSFDSMAWSRWRKGNIMFTLVLFLYEEVGKTRPKCSRLTPLWENNHKLNLHKMWKYCSNFYIHYFQKVGYGDVDWYFSMTSSYKPLHRFGISSPFSTNFFSTVQMLLTMLLFCCSHHRAVEHLQRDLLTTF